MKPPSTLLVAAAIALAVGGCSLPWLRRQPSETFPVVFPVPPTREQIIGAVNANSAPIRQLESNVTISVQGMPALRGNLALQRPLRFRLRAGLMGIPGTGVDVGSNDELFWIWLEQNRPPGVYFARHDAFAQSRLRRMVPVDPRWLIEALGVVQLDPAGIHEGPYQQTAGQVQLHTRLSTPAGPMTKITVVDERYGWVLQQYLYDDQGRLVASARAARHRYYPEVGVTLPQHVEVELAPGQPMQLALRLDVGRYRINQLSADPAQLWSMPRPQGYPLIDLADPGFTPLVQQRPAFGSAPRRPGDSFRGAFRPRYRGLVR